MAGSLNLLQALGSGGLDTSIGSNALDYNKAMGSGGLTTDGTATLGASTTAPAPDPYAQWGGQANYNSLGTQFNANADNLRSSAGSSAGTNATGYGNAVTDYLHKLGVGQQYLDDRGTQAELAKSQANQGIMGMVGRGIQSGGIALAGRNAADGSASEAIARAYGDLGHRQMNSVGNQYAQTEHNIGVDQNNFNYDKTFNAKRLSDEEAASTQGIVQNAQSRINDINNWAAGQSLPQRLNAQQEIAQIQTQISGLVDPQNQRLNSGVAGVNAHTTDQNRAAANDLAHAGTSATNPFDFQSSGPAQFNNTGVAPGSLPIYTAPRKKA